MRQFLGLALSAAIFGGAPLALADDKDAIEPVELREETRCFPAVGIGDFMKRFDGLDASRTDTLHAVFGAGIEIRDEGDYPDRFFLKTGDDEKNMIINEDGTLPEFVSLVKTASEETELCMQDKARAGTPVDQPGAAFTMPLSIRMKNETGNYDMAELADGLKDGKAFYKKMVGGAMAILVPKMTHLVVSYEEDDIPLEITVFKGEEIIKAPEAEAFNGGHVIRFKDLKKAGATRMQISGGAHRISPAPSVKTMKKFGLGG